MSASVQEWVPGGELFHHLDIEGSFSDGAACFYAANVLLALEYLHGRGIVYRDLKPENLLLDTQVRGRGPMCILCLYTQLCVGATGTAAGSRQCPLTVYVSLPAVEQHEGATSCGISSGWRMLWVSF